MKDQRFYIELAFARYDPLRLAGFAEGIVTNMTGMTEPFATTEPPLADITTAATTLRQKQEATGQGGNQAKLERDDAFDALEGLLRELAAFVEDKAKNNRDLMLSTGFLVTTASHTPPVITTPAILLIENLGEGKLGFKIQSVGAKAYELWGRTGTADFTHIKTLTDPRSGAVEGLVPGALYDWKTRALYGNDKYSEWSDVVSHRAT